MACLVDYSSSDNSEDDINAVDEPLNVVQGTESVKALNERHSNKTHIPLPDDIKNLYKDKRSSRHENKEKHQGRVRSFPHEEGNWATSVYIPYSADEHFNRLQKELMLCLRPLEFQPITDLHVSLSRTVTIRHHWIQEIMATLGKDFGGCEGCMCEITSVKTYTNDEKNRTFVALDVTAAGLHGDEDDILEQYVAVVDSCFDEYKLQKYYQPPSFHISIGWCLNDVTENITATMKTKLEAELLAAHEDPALQFFTVDKLECKTGNKQFNFPLRLDT